MSKILVGVKVGKEAVGAAGGSAPVAALREGCSEPASVGLAAAEGLGTCSEDRGCAVMGLLPPQRNGLGHTH